MLRHVVTVAALVLLGSSARGGEPVALRVAVHVDTSVSHGCRTISVAGVPIRTSEGMWPRPIETIAKIAREQGLDVLILADRARAEVSCSLTPWSRLFRITVAEGSIASYGSTAYLDRIRAAEKESGVIIIPGVECVPRYRWRGNVLTGLKLEHLYEHMVIVGLDTPDAIDGLPDAASRRGYRFSWTVLLNAVFLVFLLLGARLARRRRKRGRRFGIALAAVSLIALVDSMPFLPRAEPSVEEPGQYAESRGALAFWAHPNVNAGSLPRRLKSATGIDIEVRPYPELLVKTAHYDGFAMFNAGIEPGRPGREWDRALLEYCYGDRQRPVWAVSECDFDEESPPDGLADAQTVIWAREKSRSAALDALRRGSCYATLTNFHKRLRVEAWRLSADGTTAESGQTLRTVRPSVTLRLRLAVPDAKKSAARLRVELVVDGEATTLPLVPAPDGAALELDHRIELPGPKKVSYVRALICDNREPVLALNPVFVKREARESE